MDLAIRIGDLDDSSLSARKLGEGHVYCVASPAFLAAHGAPAAATLRETRCIGTRPVERWELLGVQAKIEPVFVVNDLEVACEAAIAGLGVARLRLQRTDHGRSDPATRAPDHTEERSTRGSCGPAPIDRCAHAGASGARPRALRAFAELQAAAVAHGVL